jgi:hypothetical protein
MGREMHSRKTTLFILFIMSITFCIHFSLTAIADDICVDCEEKSQPVLTLTGNADYSKINNVCSGATPTIHTSSSTIAPGDSITLYVDSGYLALPPYSWSVFGTGYSLNKSTTNNDLEEVTLSCASGT